MAVMVKLLTQPFLPVDNHWLEELLALAMYQGEEEDLLSAILPVRPRYE
jgi:hypothetical protein